MPIGPVRLDGPMSEWGLIRLESVRRVDLTWSLICVKGERWTTV